MDATTTQITQETKVEGQASELAPQVAAACEAAFSDEAADAGEELVRVRAAHKDLNSRGRVRELWYRMAWEPGAAAWRYFAEERLPEGTIRASDRHATVFGNVPSGTLLAQHDRGRPIDAVWLVHAPVGEKEIRVTRCEFRVTVGGLRITLPDGRTVERPNPRR